MNSIKLIFSKNYWVYLFSLRKTFNAVLGTFGIIWLLVEASSFFSQDLSTLFKENWKWLLIIGAVWIIVENRPRTEFPYKLKGKDILIQLSIGDLFKYPGDIVIPINTSLDTSFDGGLVSEQSTQGQFTIKYFNDPRYLSQDIQAALNGEQPTELLPQKRRGNKFKYDIGKVLKLKLNDNKHGYLVTNADMNNQCNTSTSFDNILTSLAKLWHFLLEEGECTDVNIPVLGTGRGRILESRETVIKAIVHSFISSTSSSKRFCNKLNIIIHPKDFNRNEINIRELQDFLRMMTTHYQYDTATKGQGQPIQQPVI